MEGNQQRVSDLNSVAWICRFPTYSRYPALQTSSQGEKLQPTSNAPQHATNTKGYSTYGETDHTASVFPDPNSLINPKDSTKGMTAHPMPAWRRVPVYMANILRAMAAQWSLEGMSMTHSSATFMAHPRPQAVKFGHSSSEDWSPDREAVDSVCDFGDKVNAPGDGTAIIGSESISSMFLDWFCVRSFKWPCTYAPTLIGILFLLCNSFLYFLLLVFPGGWRNAAAPV